MCNFHICTSPLFTFLRAGMWTWWVIFNHTDKGKPVEMAEEWGRRIKSHPLPLDSNMRKNVFILFQSRVILTSWGSHTEILTNTLALSTVMSQPLCCVLSYQPWGISRFWYASQRLDHGITHFMVQAVLILLGGPGILNLSRPIQRILHWCWLKPHQEPTGEFNTLYDTVMERILESL